MAQEGNTEISRFITLEMGRALIAVVEVHVMLIRAGWVGPLLGLGKELK